MIELDTSLHRLGNVTPDDENDPCHDAGDDINQESQGPGDCEVCRCPKQPGLDIFGHEFSLLAIVVVAVLIIQEVDSDCDADDYTRGDRGANQRGEEKVDHSSRRWTSRLARATA